MDTAVTDQDLFLCIGCGEDLTSRVKDRRNLLSPNASDVLDFWKSLHNSTLQQPVPDGLYGGKMCRRCFVAYQRMLKVIIISYNNDNDTFNFNIRCVQHWKAILKKQRRL